MQNFFETGKRYIVRVADLHSPDAETFSVSLNDKSGRYPLNEDIEMPGELIRVLLDATVPHEIVKMERGYPRRVGTKLRPRFFVTPVGMPSVPVQDATLIQPGVSEAMAVEEVDPDDGAFDPETGEEPGAEIEASTSMHQREELANMVKRELLEIGRGLGLDYTERNSNAEIITGILAAEAAGE